MKAKLIALGLLVFAGGVAVGASVRAPKAKLSIWVASVVYEVNGRANTAALYCAAATKEDANKQVIATLMSEAPSASIHSVICNQVGDDLVEKVCASRRSQSF